MYYNHDIGKNQLIAYKAHKFDQKSPTVVFVHGLLSSMESTKAVHYHSWCEANNFNYIRFDNLGSGSSSGVFSEQTISSWLYATERIIQDLCPNGAILVGSSKGGWISLLAAIKNHALVKGLVCIAAAPDFTEDIWNILLDVEKKKMQQGETVKFTSVPPYSYDIKYSLIEDAKHYLLLNQDAIPITCKVRMVHGLMDTEVSYKKSIAITEKIISQDALCILVKSGNHGLSREGDLELIGRCIREVM